MATNFEFYKDAILKTVSEGIDFSVVNGKVIECDCCESCAFGYKKVVFLVAQKQKCVGYTPNTSNNQS